MQIVEAVICCAVDDDENVEAWRGLSEKTSHRLGQTGHGVVYRNPYRDLRPRAHMLP
jgi:hypothetical protein